MATLALAVAAALGPPIALPELEHDVLMGLGDDNRVGFAFASLTLGAECGVDSTIAHSRARIAAAAKVLAAHPEADLVLEGHVGVSAPDEIAVAYSRYRAQIVGQILEDEYGVDASRIEARGWGYDVSRIAQQSEHPSASAAKAGYGWVELFFRANPCPHHAPTIVPPVPDYYDGAGPPSTQADVGFVSAIHVAEEVRNDAPSPWILADATRDADDFGIRLAPAVVDAGAYTRVASDYFGSAVDSAVVLVHFGQILEDESSFGANLGEAVFHPRRGRPTSSAAFTAALAATFCVGVALSWCSLKRAAAPKKATLRFCPAPKEGPPAGATTVVVPPALQGKHVAAAVAV